MSPVRQIILTALRGRGLAIDQLAMMTGIPLPMLRTMLDDMVRRGFVVSALVDWNDRDDIQQRRVYYLSRAAKAAMRP